MTKAMTAGGVPFPAVGAQAPDRPFPGLPKEWTSLSAAFVAQARLTPDKLFCADSLKMSVTYGEALVRAAGLAQWIRRHTGGEPAVGIMVPPSVPAALANIGVTLAGKWAVNLNYAASSDVVNSAVRQCGMDTVVTSRKALEKSGIKLDCHKVLFIEDAAEDLSFKEKGLAWLVGKGLPAAFMARFLPGLQRRRDNIATVMFSSGSEGEPKGIMLTHGNILANIVQVNAHCAMQEDDLIMGILPFFHSFGYTVTLWTIACLGRSAVYHVNPLDPRTVGKLLTEHKATLMACTPTLMRSYLARCTREQFSTVRWLLLGSEKLKPELARDIKDKLGVLALDGLGCTELSPVVSANVPHDVLTPDGRTVAGNVAGTVGQPVPGTAIAIVDRETGKLLPRGMGEGLIFASGPQVMKGYLNNEQKTSEVLANGWYYTGDIGFCNEDGFVGITDRASRFAKVGGEMVPLGRLEKTIRTTAGVDELAVAIVAVPDDARGERVVAVYTDLGMSPAELLAKLNETDLPKLWLPKGSDFVKIEKMPVGHTGKLDLKALKNHAIAQLKG